MDISILLVTYNQEKYILQALQSILSQKHGYRAELIVADDCSTDLTIKYIQDSAPKFPGFVSFIRREANVGMLVNYKEAFAQAKGKYIFILEGDDYWTDDFRIQKHVEFLEANPLCTMTMNRFAEFWQDDQRFVLPDWNFAHGHQFIETSDLARGNMLGNLSAVCIRAEAWKMIEENIFTIPAADWMIGMALAQIGPVGLLKDPMSVYRKHKLAQWSGMSSEKERAFLLELIGIYDKFLGYRYHQQFMELKERLSPTERKAASPKRSFLERMFVKMVKG